MITLREIDLKLLDKTHWVYQAITKGLIGCLTGPVLNLDPNKSEISNRFEMMVDNFSTDSTPAQIITQIEGKLLQLLLPEEELVITIHLFHSKYNKDTNLAVSLIQLNHE